MADLVRRGLLSVLQVAGSFPLVPSLRVHMDTTCRTLSKRHALAADQARVPAILSTLPRHTDIPPSDEWCVQSAQWTESDIAVFRVGPPGHLPAAVLKLSHSVAGEASLCRQLAVLQTLHMKHDLGACRALLPVPLGTGTIEGRFFLVERALPGRDMRWALLGRQSQLPTSQSLALSTIAQLHQRTTRPTVIDTPTLERWIDLPLRSLSPLIRDGRTIGRFSQLVRAGLDGRTVSVGWIHGDFSPGNLLVASDGLTITGIIDWDLAAPDEMPMHDLLNFALSTECLLHGRDIGDAVRRRLNRGDSNILTAAERSFLAQSAPSLVGHPAGERAMILSYWLRYTTTYFDKVPYRARDGWWLRKNVAGVMQAL